MRAIWKGGISFGLVYIPVKLYSAAPTSKNIEFDMLRKGDNCPIKYVRVCKSTGEEVPWKDIVKGYEYRKGDYIIMQEKDFDKASPKKTKTIDIEDFVDRKQIDPKYFDKPYFVEPTPEAAKTYALLRETLKKSGKAAVARYVIRNRQHLGLILVEDNMLYLNQMRFADELRNPEEVKVPDASKPSKKELDMALNLVEQMTSDFKPESYHDDYKEDMMKIIEAKAKSKKNLVKVDKGEEEPQATEADDLMAQLKASLKQTKGKAA